MTSTHERPVESPGGAAASARRPRVGVDFHTFDGIFQGTRSHLLGLYAEAIRRAPEIDFVFLLADPDALRREHPAFDVPNVCTAAMPHAGGLRRLGWQLAAAQRRRERLDLLHVQYRLPFVPQGPCACTVHDTLYETHPQHFTPSFVRLARWTGRRAVRQAALLFTVSEYARGELSRLYGLEPARIGVTTNGIDRRVFRPGADGLDAVRALGLEPGRYLCTVGRLEPRKNHLNLLRAYARLPRPRPPLVVVGQHDFESAPIFELARALELDGEIRFEQNVRDGLLPAVLRHARLFVYPSHAEGFGMPVLEAMASGVPVVTSNTTSLPEVAGGAALTVDPNDPGRIAGAIEALLSDPVARERAIRLGLAHAERYTWQRSAEVLVDAYRRYFVGRTAASRA